MTMSVIISLPCLGRVSYGFLTFSRFLPRSRQYSSRSYGFGSLENDFLSAILATTLCLARTEQKPFLLCRPWYLQAAPADAAGFDHAFERAPA
jgi:hypothetical protein